MGNTADIRSSENARRVVVDQEGINRIGNRACCEMLAISTKDFFPGGKSLTSTPE
jgi:hypothetical protein